MPTPKQKTPALLSTRLSRNIQQETSKDVRFSVYLSLEELSSAF